MKFIDGVILLNLMLNGLESQLTRFSFRTHILLLDLRMNS